MSANVHVEGRDHGAALRTLSRAQVRSLVLLAREAYERSAAGAADWQSFDDWRHQQTRMAVERDGLTQCRNEDFLFLRAHFLRLLGRVKEAEADLARHQMESRTWALHRLKEAVRECDRAAERAGSSMFDARSYADGFLRRKRGVGLDDADAKSLWHAYYLLRRKAELFNRSAAEVPF